MRPERAAIRLLATTRSKAKMYEYDVPEEEHIELPQSPNKLFSLAVGLLGDAAAAIADAALVTARDPADLATLSFAGTYFDAYLQSQLDDFAQGEFPILASASFYLGGNPGSSKVLINQATAPEATLGAGLTLLTYRLLHGDYGETARRSLSATRHFGAFQLVGLSQRRGRRGRCLQSRCFHSQRRL